jgi:3-methylcrotonyl-CoA carboxylase alpha subunit
MEKSFEVRGQLHKIRIAGKGDPVQATIDDREVSLSLRRVDEHEWIALVDGRQERLFVARTRKGTTFVKRGGRTYVLAPAEESHGGAGAGAEGQADGRLTAVMPGKVIKILVEQGQQVAKGDPVLILESMKMETTQEAPFAAEVVEINAAAGEQVDAGHVIVRLEPLADA